MVFYELWADTVKPEMLGYSNAKSKSKGLAGNGKISH